jgi:hypothetical protein
MGRIDTFFHRHTICHAKIDCKLLPEKHDEESYDANPEISPASMRASE